MRSTRGPGLIMTVLALAAPAGVTSAEDAERAALDFAVQRGVEIYQRDLAAWRATDAAFPVGLQGTDARGWVTMPGEDGWLVRFVAECASGFCSVLDVRVDPGRARARLLDAPAPLTGHEQTAWRARQLALSVDHRGCTRRLNTVVIPPRGGQPHWTVYLLAASEDPDAVILAAHHRVTISADGGTVLASEPLSNTCLLTRRNADAAAAFVSHVLHPYPIETHVFTSLLYRTALYVRTVAGTFAVDGARIQRVE